MVAQIIIAYCIIQVIGFIVGGWEYLLVLSTGMLVGSIFFYYF